MHPFSLISLFYFYQCNQQSNSLAGNTIDYTPNFNFVGDDTFIYEISDGNTGKSQATVTVTVTNTNDPPVAVDDYTTVAFEGTIRITNTHFVDASALNGNVADRDPDGDTLSFSSLVSTVSSKGGTLTSVAGGTFLQFCSTGFILSKCYL